MTPAWVLAAVAAVVPVFQTPPLAGVRIGESAEEMQAAFSRMSFSLRTLQSAPQFQSYLMMNSEGHVFGSMLVCRGAVFSVISNLASYDDFTAVLPDRIATFGQPKVSFRSNSVSDGSKVFEQLVYSWGGGRYEMAIDTKLASNTMPEQTIRQLGKCVAT